MDALKGKDLAPQAVDLDVPHPLRMQATTTATPQRLLGRRAQPW